MEKRIYKEDFVRAMLGDPADHVYPWALLRSDKKEHRDHAKRKIKRLMRKPFQFTHLDQPSTMIDITGDEFIELARDIIWKERIADRAAHGLNNFSFDIEV